MSVSTIIATPAHPRANSYITVAEAEQYFVDQYGTFTFSGSTSDEKAAALIAATRIIDGLRFHDTPLKRTQRLEFPRSDTYVWSANPEDALNNVNGWVTNINLANLDYMPDDFWNYGAIWFYGQGNTNQNKYYLITDFDSALGKITIDGQFAVALTAADSFELIKEIPQEIKWAVCETAEAILASTLTQNNDSNVKSQSLGDESVTYFDKSVQGVNLPAKAYDLLRPYIAVAGRTVPRGLFR